MRVLMGLVLLLACRAHAYQFDIKNAGFGTYIRGEYGLAQRGDASYADSSGTGVSFDGTRASEAGGEFGLLWSGPTTVFRVSTAVLLPKHLAGITGGVNGTPHYEMDSKVTVILPQVNLDFVMKVYPESRVLVSVGGGYAFVTTQNQYKFTPAGFAAHPGLDDHTETAKGNGLELQLAGSYEFELADHATLCFDAGYRYLRVLSLKSAGDVKTFSGTYAAGDVMKNNDGSQRTLDLGGLFAGAAFRFYF